MRKMPPGLPEEWYEKYGARRQAEAKELRAELERLHKLRTIDYKCPKCECPLANSVDLESKTILLECANCGHTYGVT